MPLSSHLNWDKERNKVHELQGTISYFDRSLAEEKVSLEDYKETLKRTEEAQDVIQTLALSVQKHVHRRLSDVVTSCLRAVFDEDAYEFQIQFDRKRGKTEAELKFVRDGIAIDPVTASGGGMIDVAAFALRAACLILHRPKLSRLIVLDEPFRFVSSDYQANVRGMLEELAKDLDMQIVFVTHNPALACGKIIVVE